MNRKDGPPVIDSGNFKVHMRFASLLNETRIYMSIDGFSQWLDATSLSTALKNEFWIVPALQSIHILAVCLVLTSASILCLRSWNVMGIDWTPRRWARRLIPPQWWALVALLLTGIAQVMAEPTRELPNPMFQSKMIGVVLAVVLALWMSRRLEMAVDPGSASAPLRLASVALVLLWLAIIFAGRWIAYV